MKNIFLALSLLIATSVFAAPATQNPTLHAIIVADEYSNIAVSCSIDQENMLYELQTVADQTGMALKLHQPDFSRSAVWRTVNGIRASANDVILFFYSGHGFRYQSGQDNDPYPFMHLSQGWGSPVDVGLSLTEVSDLLQSKGVRLTLVLGDMCNNYIPMDRSFAMSSETIREGYKRLFLYSKGSVIATSSQVGKFSYATGNGSHFTNGFLSALHSELSSRNAYQITWDDVLSEARQETLSISGFRQEPFFDARTVISEETEEEPVASEVIIPLR